MQPSQLIVTSNNTNYVSVPITNPIINKLVTYPDRPTKPQHFGDIYKDKHKEDWIDSIFESYEKMHITGTFSCPFPKTQLPPNATILKPRIVFKVRPVDVPNFYELKTRPCADGSKMIQGTDFDSSYAPTTNPDCC